MVADIPEDGLGQGFWTDILWSWRFRRLRSRAIAWEKPSYQEQAAWRADPELSRFGDFLVAVASIDGRRAWILENIWNGWPDPPRFAALVREPDGAIWLATNFHHWPKAWTKPEGLE